jgi:hypothetical protein
MLRDVYILGLPHGTKRESKRNRKYPLLKKSAFARISPGQDPSRLTSIREGTTSVEDPTITWHKRRRSINHMDDQGRKGVLKLLIVLQGKGCRNESLLPPWGSIRIPSKRVE